MVSGQSMPPAIGKAGEAADIGKNLERGETHMVEGES